MKERKKIKYVQKQPPDKTNEPDQSNRKDQQTREAQYQPRQKVEKREAKVEYQQPPQTYLVSPKDQENKLEPQRYQNNRREDYRPKFAPKDYQNKYEEHPNKDYDRHQGKDSRNYNRKDRDLQAPRFVERQSSQNDHHCIICSQDIRRRDWIWTCSCCSISMHLKCIKQWITNINEQQQRKATHIFNWKCPQCNYQYNEPMPQYYCYCGKHKNPEEDRDLAPHSCGQICSKKRGPYCPHLCPDICHRGKCRPCDYQGTLITCQCGKSQRTIKCSQQRLAFQCGKKCQKILLCQKHKCQRNCHTGECHPCKKKHMAACHCGKSQDIIDCGVVSFSCSEICDKLLDCGYHKCQDKCHTGSCNPCRKTPKLQKTCPCGKYEIEMLTGDPDYRQSCADQIPVCGMPCSKKLQCGHVCPRSCHEGRCSQCKLMVDQNCSCGLQSRKIQCWRKSKEDFKCETVCKKKRACGQHLCNQVCCKYRTSPILQNHPCELNCNKQLNCQKHQCGQPCHIGLCKKCPVIYSQAQPCPCGRTNMKPPIICGTLTPECDNICDKELSCGHKCKNICHYGPCKCYEDVVVPCRCAKQQINTTCGRQALCLGKCQIILACGHKCDLQCHRGTCEEAHKAAPCRKICNKERTDCHHVCPQICHPNQVCEQFPCEAQILVKCQCGHRQTMTLCGAKDNHKTRKGIMCNKKCDNLKRFDIFYKDKQIYYPGSMVQFAFKNYPYLQNLEARLQRYILHSDENFIEVEYKFPDNNYKILLTNLFQNHYHLNTHFYRYRNYATFTLMQSEDTMVPKPVLTEYVKLISKGIVKQSNLPFEFTIAFDSESKQKMDMIIKKLKNFLHKYYSERSQKVVSLHFWSKNDGEEALSFLENQYQTIDFKCSYNITKPEEEVEESEITSQILPVQDLKQQGSGKGQQTKLKEQKGQTKIESEVQSEKLDEPALAKESEAKPQKNETKIIKQEKSPGQFKKIPPRPSENSKLIIRKSIPTFKKNAYPEAKQNIQDIYLLDEDELYNEKTNWQHFVPVFCDKNFSPEAIQWRIRSLLIISSFFPLEEHLFHEQFNKLLNLYKKDKQSATRILEIQRIESKSVKSEMGENGIYLSNHEPEMLSYLQLHNYMAEQKINLQLSQIIEQTPEMTRTIQILSAVNTKDAELFYEHFNNADYVYACALIALVHFFRETIIELIHKGERVAAKNLYKHLLFDTQQQFIQFATNNGLTIDTRISKSTKEEVYYLKEGKLKESHLKDDAFILKYVEAKRDKKYFLTEPEQLVNEKYMTRSFFAFGDFKESVNQKYMAALVKLLKQKE